MGEGATSNLKPIKHPPYTQGDKTSRCNGGPWRQTCGNTLLEFLFFQTNQVD
jgi:hypothetical protein